MSTPIASESALQKERDAMEKADREAWLQEICQFWLDNDGYLTQSECVYSDEDTDDTDEEEDEWAPEYA